MRPTALTIAGSDSGGGAGIQADLKTFSALGVYGASVITALTAQNTVTVAGVHPVPAEFVALQIDTTLDDIPAGAVKTGMLFDADIIRAVAVTLKRRGQENIVVDPVMIAKSGDALLQDRAAPALVEELIPLARVVTPNIPEAERLAGMTIGGVDDMKLAAEKIIGLGAGSVIVKGGHMEGPALIDVLLCGGRFEVFERERIDTAHTHGTGCAFSAAIAAGLALGLGIREAVAGAEEYIEAAIRAATPLGRGHGPVHHFHKFY